MIPTGSIPRNSSLPGGNWTLEVEEIEDVKTVDGRRMLKATCRSVAPVPGLPHFENFVIGTEHDAAAADPNTWIASFAATRLMQICDKAGAQLPDECEVDELCEAVRGLQFDAIAVQSVDDGKKNPKYKGQVRTQLTAFFEPGTLDKGTAPGSSPAQTRPQGRPVPRATAPAPRAPAPAPRSPVAEARGLAAQAQAGNGVDAPPEEYEEPEAAPTPAARTPTRAPQRPVPRRV